MAQKIDTSEFSDQFTDGTVRYSTSGIERVAKNNWSFTLGYADGVHTIRVYQNGILTDFNAASTTPLSQTNTALKIYKSPNTLIASYSATEWSKQSTGVYTVAETNSFLDGAYVIELEAQASFTNPVVSGKTSVLTDASASYPSEIITVKWISSSISIDGQIASDPIFDAVDFALNGNIAFR
jgi:hypothetical protein